MSRRFWKPCQFFLLFRQLSAFYTYQGLVESVENSFSLRNANLFQFFVPFLSIWFNWWWGPGHRSEKIYVTTYSLICFMLALKNIWCVVTRNAGKAEWKWQTFFYTAGIFRLPPNFGAERNHFWGPEERRGEVNISKCQNFVFLSLFFAKRLQSDLMKWGGGTGGSSKSKKETRQRADKK